ncbi:major facilitator superfamily domain-containing protein [Circinella umbellata]|nr:major facilitator superfamily domain-containing protein [Circinella umbellata]
MTGFAGTIYYPSIPEIETDLKATSLATTLAASLFVLFAGIFPIIWGSILDFYHIRRLITIISIVIFILSSLGIAVVNNIWALVILRCCQAIGASPGQVIGSAVITDLYPVETRGRAYGKFFLGMFIGPIIAPTIGGFLAASGMKWRATFLFCLAFGGVLLVLVVFCVPETYRDHQRFDDSPILPTTAAVSSTQEITSDTNITRWTTVSTISKEEVYNKQLSKKKKFNPVRPFALLRFPHILLPSLATAIIFGSMFSIGIPIILFYNEIQFDMNNTLTSYYYYSKKIGLAYLGGGIGHIFGAIFSGYASDKLLLRNRSKRANGQHMIEDLPLGLLLFGWSITSGMSYWYGIVGFGIQCFATNQIMATVGAYLSDANPEQPASAAAAKMCIYMTICCILSLTSLPILQKIGAGYLTIILAVLSWCSAALLLIIKIYGHQLRRHFGLEQNEEWM